ncbi:predicted protein [Naegleria gruberi]|uniref:Predicted protein n=1 Tax=Naegleria gruberi TaxID=5762 RepID=D2W424_NAEGR|nr:uncharacterized protein NAEGRDRAFT_76154 [Naegleria gruberi]EFC36169.1 predicted protein [Naegleria gruberi]|eukprot:XP_002668913.1 predicted protein [Naegleria gruberi strain NEG-M]
MSKIKPADMLEASLQQIKNVVGVGSSSESVGKIVVNVSKILEENSAYLGITTFYESNKLTSSQFGSSCRNFQKCLDRVEHLELSGNQLEYFIVNEKLTSDSKYFVSQFAKSLTFLDLSNNMIKNFPIECLSIPLKILNLENNLITSLENLVKELNENKSEMKLLNCLESLNISKNLIQHFPFYIIVKKFKKVDSIDLGENPLQSLSINMLKEQKKGIFGSNASSSDKNEDIKILTDYSDASITSVKMNSIDLETIRKRLELKTPLLSNKTNSIFNLFKKKISDDISFDNSKDFFPVELFDLPNIQHLDLSKNKHLNYSKMKQLVLSPSITSLNLSNCQLDESVSRIFKSILNNSIRKLILHNNNIKEILIEDFPNIISINLSNNIEYYKKDENIYNILSNVNPKIEELTLKRVFKNEEGYKDLLNLSLIRNNLEVPKIGISLSKFSSIRSLTLSGLFLSSIPLDINQSNMPNIEFLDLSENEIGDFSSNLLMLTELKSIDLSFNNISTIDVDDEMCNLTKLTSLDLSHNNLTEFPIDLVLLLPSIDILSLEYNTSNLKTAREDKNDIFNQWMKDHSSVKIKRMLIEPSLILERLYLGGNGSAQSKHNMKLLGITHVLNVAEGLIAPYPFDFKYKKVELSDTLGEDLLPHIDACVKFIEEAIDSQGTILVHCKAGVSRSASMVIAYVMKKFKLSLDEATQMVKEKRSQICPNGAFVKQLEDYGRLLNRESH